MKKAILGVAAAMALLGLGLGAIGAALLGNEPFVPLPEVHLAPQEVFTVGGFTVTNTLLSAWLTTIVVVLLFGLGAKSMKMVPGRLQGFVEMFIEALYNFIKGVAGERFARPFFPILATIFIFVSFNAWMALLPIYPTVGFFAEGRVAEDQTGEHGGAGQLVLETADGSIHELDYDEEHPPQIGEEGKAKFITTHLLRSGATDINLPIALAMIGFLFAEVWGFKVHRLGYLREFFRGPNPIQTFVGLLELLSHFIRLISFTFRLFGNMLAGEIILFMMTFLLVFMAPIAFYGLEILVGGVQALIFMGLTLVFTVMAVAPHEGHEDERSEAAAH